MTAPAAVGRGWLRAESLGVFLLCLAVYWLLDGNWLLFGLLFLAPDLSFAAYLAGRRRGILAYNLAHVYLWPALLAAVGIVAPARLPVELAVIWAAHLGLDRTLGFGLRPLA